MVPCEPKGGGRRFGKAITTKNKEKSFELGEKNNTPPPKKKKMEKESEHKKSNKEAKKRISRQGKDFFPEKTDSAGTMGLKREIRLGESLLKGPRWRGVKTA